MVENGVDHHSHIVLLNFVGLEWKFHLLPFVGKSMHFLAEVRENVRLNNQGKRISIQLQDHNHPRGGILQTTP